MSRRASRLRSPSPAGRARAPVVVEHAPPPRGGAASSLAALLRRTFLPAGYPASVSSDYAAFQFYDSLQGLCSYVRGTMSTAALLEAVGVGKTNASALSATLSFLVRDMAGHVGSLAFAATCTSFDSEAKQWRFFADVANNAGLWLNLAAPLVPRPLFLPTLCLASLAHAVTGVAGGSTRAALTQHFTLRGNAADVASKESSQETAVTLCGMLLGGVALRAMDGSLRLSWFLFSLLTALHLLANAAAMRTLRLTLLTRERLQLLCGQARVLTPAEVAAREHLLPAALRLWGGHDARIRLGVPLSALPRPLADAAQPYTCAVAAPPRRRRSAPPQFLIALRLGASQEECARAVVHCLRASNSGNIESALAAPDSDAAWADWLSRLRSAGWGELKFSVCAGDEGFRYSDG